MRMAGEGQGSSLTTLIFPQARRAGCPHQAHTGARGPKGADLGRAPRPSVGVSLLILMRAFLQRPGKRREILVLLVAWDRGRDENNDVKVEKSVECRLRLWSTFLLWRRVRAESRISHSSLAIGTQVQIGFL